MASPIGNGHFIDAGVTLAIVVLVQAAYCTLKWQARVASRFEWWRLFACASVLGTLALVFLSLGATSQRSGYYKLAYAMLICCKGTSVLSIWCFEVLDVLYPSKDGWLQHATAPFSNWGTLIFWIGLAIQCLFICLGLWSMASFRTEFLWATPLISHINISAMAGYALGSSGIKTTLLQLWVVAGVAASIASLGFCIAATRTLVAGHAPVQCIICAGILSVKAYRDWQTAKGRANGREEFPHDEPRDAPLSDTIRPSNRDLEAPSANALHHFQRCGSGSDSGVGLTSLASATSSDVSLSSSTTAPSEAYRRYGAGSMHFLAKPFSIFRIDQQMIECYRTIHAFHRQINDDKLMPEAVGRVSSILDVGTGTGDWAMDMAAAYPKIQVIGTDLSPIQTHHSPYNVAFYIEDANRCNWIWRERFDYIHFRDVDGGIEDWGLTLNAAFSCLRPEGFLSLSDLIFHQPPCDMAPGSIWDEWQRALDALKAATGLSFGLHESGRARNELENSGYKIVEEDRRSFQLRQKSHMYDDYDLLQSIIEQMKGVFARALEFQPTVIDRQCLVNRLEEEVQHGLEITVARIVAQKPASIQPVLDCGKNAAVDVEG